MTKRPRRPRPRKEKFVIEAYAQLCETETYNLI